MFQEVNDAVAPTLPPWVWVFYYFCIGIGLALTVMHLLIDSKHPRERMWNLFNMTFLLTVPVIFLVNSIGRNGTEYHNFLIALREQQGWAIFVVLGYLYVVIRTGRIVQALWRHYKERKKEGISIWRS